MVITECKAQPAVEVLRSSRHVVENVCVPFLIDSQNPDGGWGNHPGAESSVEATAWATMALAAAGGEADVPDLGPNKARAFAWLHQTQLADGSWPPFAGQLEGCWCTSLACLALVGNAESEDRVARGLNWLVEQWPAEGSLWRRYLSRLSRKPPIVRQDSSLKGWSWTPGTASWVEPTAYALILVSSAPPRLHPPGTLKRTRLAERMLYDRMCSAGGWNTGNPQVYGVAGIPRVGPTAWALLALRHHAERSENRQSLNWLEESYSGIRGPASLALAHLCLSAYGRRVPPLGPALRAFYRENQFLRSVVVFAWAAIALARKQPWATPDATEHER